MLIESQLAKKFWGEEPLTTVFLANMSPLKMTNKTLFAMWHNKKTDNSGHRVFGSLAYTLITPVHSKALNVTVTAGLRKSQDNCGARGIFVGYALMQQAWKVLYCETGLIVHTIHAFFDESGSLAAMKLQQLETQKLVTRTELAFDYLSRLANSIPELVFYPEPSNVQPVNEE